MKMLCLAVCLFLASTAHGGSGLYEGVTPLGTDLIGTPVPLGGNLILEYEGAKGVIRDYTDPAAPAWVSELTFNLCLFDHVVYRDGWLIGLSNEVFRGATLIDLHDPAQPAVVSSAFAPYVFTTAHLLPGAVYLMTDEFLAVYDLSQPALPTFATLASLAPRTAYRWPAEHGALLYLVETEDRLRVFDTSNPATPVDLGQVALSVLRIEAMVVAGGYLQVVQLTAGGLELATYDVSAPLAPVLVATSPVDITPQEYGISLVADDGNLHVASAAGGLQAFSLADPAQPQAGFALPDAAQELGLAENGLFVRLDRTIRVLSRAPHEQPPQLLHEHTELPRLATVVTNGRVSCADVYAGPDVDLLDIANSTTVVLAEELDEDLIPGYNRLEGDLLTNFGETEFALLDVADPANPVLLSTTAYGVGSTFPLGGEQDGDLVAICVDNGDVVLYSIANPALPIKAATIRGQFDRVAIDGKWLAARSSDSVDVLVYDVENIFAPEFLGGVAMPETRAIAVARDHLLVLQEGLLSLFAIAGEEELPLVGALDLSGNRKMVVAGTHAYVYGLDAEVVDFANPAEPTIVGRIDRVDAIQGLGAANGIIHLITDRGTTVLRDDTWTPTAVPGDLPLASRLATPAPNPFNPLTTVTFEVGRTQQLRLSVHDLRGRLVAELASGSFAAGRHTVTWQGADRDGRAAASGVYVFRLVSEDGTTSRRATLVR